MPNEVIRRHPTDQTSIAYGKWCLISAVVYAVIIAVWTYAIYEGLTTSGAGILSLLSLAATPAMALSGATYMLFGRSKRLRIRYRHLISIHFFGANAAVIVGIAIGLLEWEPQNIPLAQVEPGLVALYLAASGVFVVNLWRSLQSNPAQRQPTA